MEKADRENQPKKT